MDSRSSLEYGTKLVTPGKGRWRFVLYPGAAEGGGCFRSTLGEGSPAGGSGRSPNPDQSELDAARRARGKVRRYCAENRLNRLGTLTYAGAGCHEPARLRDDLAQCFQRLRGSVGESLPYLWVPEWHPGGHGLHAHFAVGRWIPQGAIKSAWGRGHVHIKLLGDLPVGSGSLGEARLAARYLSKYVGKDFAAKHPAGLHRYEVAQGFQPHGVALDDPTMEGVLSWAATYTGAAPERVWRSRDEDDWAGPPAVWASWA